MQAPYTFKSEMENSNVRTFVTFLVGILIGGVLGYMVFGIDPVQAEVSSGLSRDVAQTNPVGLGSPSVAAELQKVDAEAVRQKPKKAPAGKVTTGEAEALARDVQLASIDPLEGEGVISGKVIDDEGEALANVTVQPHDHVC